MRFSQRHWLCTAAAVTLAAGLTACASSSGTGKAAQAGPVAAPAASAAAQPAPAAAPAVAVPQVAAAAAAPAPSAAHPYHVVDGNRVDANTLEGWHTWRAMACERCHGATQDGLVGPSLNADLKTMSKEDFKKCVLQGRIEKGMPNFGGSKMVVENIDNLYAYLKGRSDGAIKPGHLHPLP